jgi:predicted nucleic acid-binding protein
MRNSVDTTTTERDADLLNELLALSGVNANLVPDAHLEALTLEHGLTRCSSDGDFARFQQLHWLPLAQ